MSINMSNDKNIPTDTEAYYETVASQEEIYLEETEEEARTILISEDPSTYLPRPTVDKCNDFEVKRSMTDANNDPCMPESLDEQLDQAAEELITGDSDDPPLSEEAVVDMLRHV